jgi:PAS domain S-box-containing protein
VKKDPPSNQASGSAPEADDEAVQGREGRHAGNALEKENRDLEEQVARRTNEIAAEKEKFALAIDTIPALVWSSRPDGGVDFFNRRWLDYTGLTAEQALGWGWRAAIHPEDLRVLEYYWQSVLASETAGETEARLRRFDGAYRWFLFRCVPLQDGLGRVIKWYGTNTDIDDRKRAEEKLRRSEAYLAEAQRLSLVGSFDLTLPQGELGWSDQTARISGYEPGTKPALELAVARVHPEDIAAVLAIHERAFRERTGMDFEHRLLMPDNSIKHVHVVASIMREEANSIEYVGAVIDTTERTQAADALRASEHLARGQLEALTRTLDVLARESSADRIVEAVLRTVTCQLDASATSVWLREKMTGSMVFEYVLEDGKFKSRADVAFAALSRTLPVEDAWPWPEVFRTGKPFLMEDIREGPAFPWREHLLARGVITIIVVPMLIAGQVEGVLNIRFVEKRTCRAEEMELAQALAHQAMLAIQLSSLSEQSRKTAVLSERNRMARDIHDTLAQSFTGVIMQLEAAKRAVVRGTLAGATQHLESASEMARLGLTEARRSVRAIRPRSLREGTLPMALDGMLKRMSNGTELNAELRVDGERRIIPEDWQEGLLRIAQESLTNTIKHSKARNFRATLNISIDRVELQLADDGQGFDPQVETDGFGLIGMKERADQMGGNFILRTKPGEGTELIIILNDTKPLQPEIGDEEV